jgi:hypothetical protein
MSTFRARRDNHSILSAGKMLTRARLDITSSADQCLGIEVATPQWRCNLVNNTHVGTRRLRLWIENDSEYAGIVILDKISQLKRVVFEELIVFDAK